jgi:LacI family transcriptional regulator
MTERAQPDLSAPTVDPAAAAAHDSPPAPRQPAGPGGVTLHDVARAAGVSLATASRVLNGSARRVADSYRERVEAAARKLGYTANLSAQATARGTSNIIALLVADIADPYFGQIAAGVARGADEAGLVLTIAITERDARREAALVRTLRGQRPRGLILAASRTAAAERPEEPEPSGQPELRREIEAFASFGGRVVAIGRGAPELRSVPIDNFGAARNLGLAMAGRGYRRAVVLAAGVGVISSDDRLAGFTAGFAEGGGKGVEVYRGGFTREAGWQAMRDALAAGIEPHTVVFGVSDVVAIGAMSAIRDAGRRVGDDIAVCGFDDIATSRDVTPALSTVHIPLEDVGYQALRAIVDDDWDAQAAGITHQVVLRDSTPPVR